VRHLRKKKGEDEMKLGEYEAWMNELATVSGCSREMLERTPARVLFAFNNAIQERDRARAALALYRPNDPIEEGIRRSQRGKE
jgi:hypothetical protein